MNVIEEKQELVDTPKKVIIEDWSPSVCPHCKKDFFDFEECWDGYYQRAYNLDRCPYCKQRIEWK